MPVAMIAARRLHYRAIPGDAARPPLVFLHEGLGSAELWRDFPDRLVARLGARALLYSRFGYGHSDGLEAKRTPQFMHEEALSVLPALLEVTSIEAPLLLGHSDGASIALIHAARARRPVAGLVLMAPHVFVEPVCLREHRQDPRRLSAKRLGGGRAQEPARQVPRPRRRCLPGLGRRLAGPGLSHLDHRGPDRRRCGTHAADPGAR